MSLEPRTLHFGWHSPSGQPLNVVAQVKGDPGVPGSLSVPPTLWVDWAKTYNAAGRLVHLPTHEIPALYTEIERRVDTLS